MVVRILEQCMYLHRHPLIYMVVHFQIVLLISMSQWNQLKHIKMQKDGVNMLQELSDFDF